MSCYPYTERLKLTEPEPIETVITLQVPRDHRALAGHFPGRPMVPGVMLVDAVVRKIDSSGRWGQVARVVNAKFLRPVLGDMTVSVSLRVLAPARVAYEARSGGEVVALGTLEFEEHRRGCR